MTDAEQAWLALEFSTGTNQSRLAREINAPRAMVNREIRDFCRKWFAHDFNEYRGASVYDLETFALYAFNNYTGEEITKPQPWERYNDGGYYAARREHAWLLRAEGLTYREIGERLGTGRERARGMVAAFSRKVTWATQRTRFEVTA